MTRSEPSIPPSGEANKLPLASHVAGSPAVESRGRIDLSKMAIDEVLDIKRQLIALEQMGRFSCSKHKVAAETVWDWSKSDTEIARINLVSVGSVRGWRKKLAKPPAPRDCALLPTAHSSPLEGRQYADWESLDWSKPNAALAKEAGVTREWIRQKRAQLGKPKTFTNHFKFNSFRDEFKGVLGLSFEDARLKFPTIAQATFVSYCGRLNLKRVSSRKPSTKWDGMNWSLPNKILGEIWGVAAHSAAVWRCNHNLQKAGFRFLNGGSRKSTISEKWLSVIESEKEKASRRSVAEAAEL